MNLKPAPNRPSPAQRGFTLIELMIAVVVVGVLLAIALPSFMDSIRKGRRAEAFAALAQVQQAQERWRANRDSYATGTQIFADPDADPPRSGLPVKTPNGYYAMAITGPSATGYTVTATAESGKSQASDANCQVLAARMVGGNLEYGSGASTAAFPDSGRCLAR